MAHADHRTARRLASNPQPISARPAPLNCCRHGAWSWSCAASNGGTTASWFQPHLHRRTVTAFAAHRMAQRSVRNLQTNLCSAGTTSTVCRHGALEWSCAGSNAERQHHVSLLTPPAPVTGICGTSNGTTVGTNLPNLCSTGTSQPSPGTGPWTWSCAGINGGTNASCSAN